jgi:lipid-A-disaccharide synthase
VCSGTATLETALFNVPQIVFYRTNLVNYLIAKVLIKVKYISLVNLILQKTLVAEVIYPIKQGKKLEETFNELLKMENQVQLSQGYEEIRIHLGNKRASKECSKIIFNV